MGLPRNFIPSKIAIKWQISGTDDAYKSISEYLPVWRQQAGSPRFPGLRGYDAGADQKHPGRIRGPDNSRRFRKEGHRGKIAVIRYARENNVPILGICLGMQLMVIEYARNVAGLKALTPPNSIRRRLSGDRYNGGTEEDTQTRRDHETGRTGDSKKVGTLLMGAYGPVRFTRHRHRYEVNYEDFGTSSASRTRTFRQVGDLVQAAFVEAIELPGRDFFLGFSTTRSSARKWAAPVRCSDSSWKESGAKKIDENGFQKREIARSSSPVIMGIINTTPIPSTREPGPRSTDRRGKGDGDAR